MKKLLANTFLTTGACLVLLALVVRVDPVYDIDFATTVLHTFFPHLVINAGLRLTERWEFSYRILNYAVDFAWSTIVVIIITVGFGWFAFTSVWVLLAISVVVHYTIFVLEIHRVRSEIKEINRLIKEKLLTDSCMIRCPSCKQVFKSEDFPSAYCPLCIMAKNERLKRFQLLVGEYQPPTTLSYRAEKTLNDLRDRTKVKRGVI